MIIEEISMTEFSVGVTKTRTVIIPFGSVEEHGPHLPLSTDTIQAYEVSKKVAARRPVFIAPPIHYGNCRSTRCHPGTISISTTTLKALVFDIVSSLYDQGMRNFILLSGHAGGSHCMALQDAGEDLLYRYDDIKIAVVIEFALARSEASAHIETPGDSHAGEIETSRIMHTHPNLVSGTAEQEYPQFPASGILVRHKHRYWQNGVWGDPTKASAEKGKLIEQCVVDKLITLVEEIETYTELESIPT